MHVKTSLLYCSQILLSRGDPIMRISVISLFLTLCTFSSARRYFRSLLFRMHGLLVSPIPYSPFPPRLAWLSLHCLHLPKIVGNSSPSVDIGNLDGFLLNLPRPLQLSGSKHCLTEFFQSTLDWETPKILSSLVKFSADNYFFVPSRLSFRSPGTYHLPFFIP